MNRFWKILWLIGVSILVFPFAFFALGRILAVFAPWISWDVLNILSYIPPHLALAFALVPVTALLLAGRKTYAHGLIVLSLGTYLWDGDHSIAKRIWRAGDLIAHELDSKGPTFTALALNAQCYTKGYDRVIDFMEEYQSDIIFLSENCREKFASRKKGALRLPAGYHWPSPESSTAVLSRHPVIAYRDVELPSPSVSLTKNNGYDNLEQLPRRQFAHALILIEGQLVHAVSLRFIAGRAPSHHPIDKLAWGLKLFEYQKQELRFVQEYISQLSGPVLVGGDLNAPPGSYPIATLLRSLELKDASIETNLFGGKTFRNDIFATIRLDYLLASPQIRILKTNIIKNKISDHYPLIGTFSLGSSSDNQRYSQLR